MSRLRQLLDKNTLTAEEKAELSKLFLSLAQHEAQLQGLHRMTPEELAFHRRAWRRGVENLRRQAKVFKLFMTYKW
jgi:hypothetical protein